MKANGASRNMTSIGLVMLMLTSLLLAGVVAEVADGNGTTGIDRNPNPQEQDLIKPTRTYHPESTHSLLSLDIGNGFESQDGVGQAAGNMLAYGASSGAWNVGDGTSAEFDGSRANVSMGAGENTPIVLRNKADGTVGQEVTMTLKNYYSSIDR